MCGPPKYRIVAAEEQLSVDDEKASQQYRVATSDEATSPRRDGRLLYPAEAYLPRDLGLVLFKNGRFLTLAEAEPRVAVASEQTVEQRGVQFRHEVEAMGVRDGVIVALGSEREVLAALQAFNETPVYEVDLQGHWALPGFIASHEHLAQDAWHVPDINFFPTAAMDSKHAALRAVEAAVQRRRRQDAASGLDETARDWIHGYNYDNTAAGFQDLTREELDQVCPDYPLKIYHASLHRLYFNTAAMDRLSEWLYDGMPDLSEGHFHRTADGSTLLGIADESACTYITSRLPMSPTYADDVTVAALKLATVGVTSVFDAYSWDAFLDGVYGQLRRHGGGAHPPFPLRLGVYIGEISSLLPGQLASSPWFVGLGRKFLLDGSIQLRTARLSRGYHDLPHVAGALRDPDTKRQRIVDYHRQGIQLALHCNGDGCIDWLLDVLDEAQRDHPVADARHRIEHCQTVRADQLHRMASAGVMANFFVNHVYYYGDRHCMRFLGPERARRISPLRSAIDAGVTFALHNDLPVTPINPLFTIWVANRRQTSLGFCLGPDERISLDDALRCYTIDAAYQGKQELNRGTLAPGKYADFVVLSQNPLLVEDADDILAIRVKMTVQSGHVIYSDQTIPCPDQLAYWANKLRSFIPRVGHYLRSPFNHDNPALL